MVDDGAASRFGPAGTDPASLRVRRLPELRALLGYEWPGRIAAGALLVLVGYTALIWVVPELRLRWFSPTGRVVLEVVELCVALFTALALLLPDDGEVESARNAFIAALLTLGVSNVVFGVGPLLTGTSAALGGVRSFYPWLAARYVVGVLFIGASLGFREIRLRWYLLAVAVALVAVDLVLVVVRDELPLPFAALEFSTGGVLVPVASLPQQLVIAVVPAVLFLTGAWLAARVFAQGASVLYWFIALGLTVQAVGKVQEVLYPAVLGPLVTSADLLRAVFFLLLLTGALLKVRQIVRDRGTAVQALTEDLRAEHELLGRMRDFTDREEAFRSVVVHELATPIAALRAFAHVLADPRAEPGSPRRQVASEGLRAESRRLQELVSRMEELRGLELDEFSVQLQPIRLRPLLDEAVGFVRGLEGGHRARVAWDCAEVRVHADPVRLSQALRNVVTNAAAYSPDRAPITLTCRPTDHLVRVEVVDQGPGIAPGDRERVQRKFARGSGAERHAKGAGLGLYVTAKILQAHGGRLLIEDGPEGRGTKVVLELRRAG